MLISTHPEVSFLKSFLHNWSELIQFLLSLAYFCFSHKCCIVDLWTKRPEHFYFITLVSLYKCSSERRFWFLSTNHLERWLHSCCPEAWQQFWTWVSDNQGGNLEVRSFRIFSFAVSKGMAQPLFQFVRSKRRHGRRIRSPSQARKLSVPHMFLLFSRK